MTRQAFVVGLALLVAVLPASATADVNNVFVRWVKIQDGAVTVSVSTTIGGAAVSPCGSAVMSGVFYGTSVTSIESVRAQFATALLASRQIDVIAQTVGAECQVTAVTMR